MIWTTTVDNQLFVWFNGELIYKRWLNYGYGMVFDNLGAFTCKRPARRKEDPGNEREQQ